MPTTPQHHVEPALEGRTPPRYEPPPCPNCAAEASHVASRTEYCLYVRCKMCGHVWSTPKPGVKPL